MDKEFAIVLSLAVLAFLFVLPAWTEVKPSLSVSRAVLQNGTLSFSVGYSAPEPKSCYLVVYGPFRYRGIGTETGNNIYVLRNTRGTVSDSLPLQNGATLDTLRVEMWCDNDRVAEIEKRLEGA